MKLVADLADQSHAPEDKALMASYQKGDKAAFETLYRRHRKGIYNFCLRMTGSKELAQDAAQEIFLRVIRGAERYTPSARFTTWLYTIARNHLVDLSRRRPAATMPKLVQSEETTSPPQSDPPLKRVLNEAIATLATEQREVFLLRAYAEMSFDEVAEVVSAPINTVRSRMRLAVTHLKKRLSQEGVEP